MAEKNEAVAESKRIRESIDELAEEFVCPITQELPLDPVMAEDGRVYERKAIEDWFATRQAGQLKSPVTNEEMGRRLFPAVQMRNTIRAMVESGALTGSKVDAWKARIEGEEKVKRWREKADGGDAKAEIEPDPI